MIEVLRVIGAVVMTTYFVFCFVALGWAAIYAVVHGEDVDE